MLENRLPVNVRIDTQPPGHGSEPHLDFIVTDLDGMLAQLCGPGAFGVRPGFSGSEVQTTFAVSTSHVSAQLGSRAMPTCPWKSQI
jgi:hypothetical protein